MDCGKGSGRENGWTLPRVVLAPTRVRRGDVHVATGRVLPGGFQKDLTTWPGSSLAGWVIGLCW